jgi:tetratricopeptide (TPR) repeat protein
MSDARVSASARTCIATFAASLAAFLLAGCGADDPLAGVRELQLEGNYQASLEPAREAFERQPDDPETQYRYGMALGRTGEMSLAQFSLRKAMESPEWRVQAGLELAAMELLTDNAEGAVEVANQVLESQPDHVDGLLLRSRAWAMSRSHYDRSLADADRVRELDPGNIEALSLRAVSLIALSRLDEAEEAMAQLDASARDAESEEQIAGFCAMRALFAKEKGELDKAEQLFDECVEAHPNDPDVVKESLKFFDEQHRPDHGVEILRKALADAPAQSQIRRMLAERLRQSGKVSEAEQILREGTELENPGRAVVAWVDLADHFHAVEDDQAAAEALSRAVQIAGAQADPELLFNFADALVMAGRFDDAHAVAGRITVPAQRELVEGRIALDEGKPADALAHFSAGLRLWPDNAVARYYAARAAEALGDYDRAVAEYRYSLRAGSDATDARLRLGRLQEALGQNELALGAAQHDNDRSPAGLEADLLALRVAGRSGNAQALGSLLSRYHDQPAQRAQAFAAAAEGVRDRLGPKAAATGIERAKELDLTDPRDAAALRIFVDCLVAAGETTQALAAAKAALAKHPEPAVFYEIQGAALEASGAGADAVRAAYARAVELDPGRSARALAGLARLAAASDVATALEDYRLAAAADPHDAAPLRASAELLLAQGRQEEAEARLAEAVARDPYDGASAARLAGLLLDRGGDLDRALALAKAAARFERSAESEALLARVYERRGEPLPAKAAPPAAPQP